MTASAVHAERGAEAAREPGRRVSLGSALAAATIGLAVLAAWRWSGVSATDISLFLGYEFLWVIAPGITVYAMLGRRGGWLPLLGFGWAIGHSLELIGFMLTAATGTRGLFYAWPILVMAPTVAFLRRREWRPPPIRLAPRASWLWIPVGLLLLAYVVGDFFVQSPLPESGKSVAYLIDIVFDISIAADAKHHWPITNPSVAGLDLPYHWFTFVHWAGVSQVTGIPLANIAFRLDVIAVVLALAIQLAAAGLRLTGRGTVAALAVVFALVLGELDLLPREAAPFFGDFFPGLYRSPTYGFGLLFFIPLIVLLAARLDPERDDGSSRGEWILVGLLLFGAAGSKASILPVLLGGLGLFGLWQLVVKRRIFRATLVTLATALGAFIASYVLLYSGGSDGLDVDFAAVFDRTMPLRVIEQVFDAGSVGRDVLWPFALVAWLVALLIPVAGVVLVRRHMPGNRLAARQAWLLALLASSLIGFLVVNQPGLSQVYFLWYGYAAGCLLAAEGADMAWRALARTERVRPRVLAVIALVWAGSLVAVAMVANYALDLSEPRQVALVYGYLGFGTLALIALARVRRPSWRRARYVAPVALAAILVASALDGVLDRLFLIDDARNNVPLYRVEARPFPQGLTPDLARGLEWVREHSDPDDVLAVNNHFVDARELKDSRYFYYSAFAERRVYLESWAYTPRAYEIGQELVARGTNPFPRRLGLNNAVFQAGDPDALEILVQEHRVRWLLVDKAHGDAIPALESLGDRVYSNPAIDAYRVGPA